jgi:hypothetical protein
LQRAVTLLPRRPPSGPPVSPVSANYITDQRNLTEMCAAGALKSPVASSTLWLEIPNLIAYYVATRWLEQG